MSDRPARLPCSAITASGNPCKNLALVGSTYCRVHQLKNTPEPADRIELEGDKYSPSEGLQPAAEGIPSEHDAGAPEDASLPQQLMQQLEKLISRMRESISEDLLDVDTWKGVWYMLNYTMEYQTDFLKRRMNGEYETDEWGLDMEFVEIVKPFFDFLYYKYWRIEASGLENVPADGRALLVSNHSGQLPWDGAMVGLSIYNEHPSHRLVRTLYATWFPTLPFFSALFTKLGQALATEENGTRLLEQNELVAVFPEGYKGVGKLFKERYRLARFGRGGFIRMALKSQATIIPVSVVGAEETYISLAKSPTIARMIGFPYFPISPTFPWLGILGFIPLPTKWYIDFGEPIPMDRFDPQAANNPLLVSQLTDQVRNIVQEMILQRLSMRKSVIFG